VAGPLWPSLCGRDDTLSLNLRERPWVNLRLTPFTKSPLFVNGFAAVRTNPSRYRR